MTSLFKLLGNVALTISENTANSVWFSRIRLKCGYSQILLSSKASNQCNSKIGGGDIKASYRFKTRFYGLREMPIVIWIC